jgi:hypothetical protein
LNVKRRTLNGERSIDTLADQSLADQSRADQAAMPDE